MSILPDWQIEELAKQGMITPFMKTNIKPANAISAGPSSYGYDITLGDHFRVADPGASFGGPFDPKKPNDWRFLYCHRTDTNPLILAPHGFALGVSVERFKIPRDLMVICLGKSTYARANLHVNITPLEPEWEGYLTLELYNALPFDLVVYPGEGIAQLLFFRVDGKPCETSYKDKKGKYQDQCNQPTLSRS